MGGAENGKLADKMAWFTTCLRRPVPSQSPGCMPKPAAAGRVELGRVYAKLGREEEAERELRLAKTLPVEDINAYLQLLDGQAILRSLKQRGRRRGPFGRCRLACLPAHDRDSMVPL